MRTITMSSTKSILVAKPKVKRKPIKKGITGLKAGFYTCPDLQTFEKRLTTETNEKIVSNNGYQIITNKACYRLAFGEVTRSELK